MQLLHAQLMLLPDHDTCHFRSVSDLLNLLKQTIVDIERVAQPSVTACCVL